MQPPRKKQKTDDYFSAINSINAPPQNWGNSLNEDRIWEQFSKMLHFPEVPNSKLSIEERVGCQASVYREAASRILGSEKLNVPITLETVRIWRAVILENNLGSLSKISSPEEQNILSSQEYFETLVNASRLHDILSVWKAMGGQYEFTDEVVEKFKSWVERHQLALLDKTNLDLKLRSLSSLPQEISKMRNLQTLCLYGNALESLPDSIGSLIRLKELNVSKNFLCTLPGTFGNLRELRVLNAENNLIHFLPETLAGLGSLKELYLKENRLAALPNSFGLLNGLKEVDLRNNRLRRLPDKLPIQLVLLDAGNNRLTALPQSIGELGQLKQFSVHGNCLESLPPSIQKLESLRSLYLSENPLFLPVIPSGLNRLILDNRQWEKLGRSPNLTAKKVSVIHNEEGVGIYVTNYDLEEADSYLG